MLISSHASNLVADLNVSDIDECVSDRCQDNSDCENTIGAYACSCKVGYKEVNGACVGEFLQLLQDVNPPLRLHV